MPHSLKKKGAPDMRTLDSQKNAKPAHKRLKGIVKASDFLSRMPVLGLPTHINFSSAVRLGFSSFSMSRSSISIRLGIEIFRSIRV